MSTVSKELAHRDKPEMRDHTQEIISRLKSKFPPEISSSRRKKDLEETLFRLCNEVAKGIARDANGILKGVGLSQFTLCAIPMLRPDWPEIKDYFARADVTWGCDGWFLVISMFSTQVGEVKMTVALSVSKRSRQLKLVNIWQGLATTASVDEIISSINQTWMKTVEALAEAELK